MFDFINEFRLEIIISMMSVFAALFSIVLFIKSRKK